MTRWKHRVKHRFSELATQWAAYYADADPPPSRRHLVARQWFALEMLESANARSRKILDAGCGSGVMAAKLTERGYAVWGIDFAAPMIRQARERAGSGQFAVGDIEHIPFPDNTFDAVVSLGVLEYLESDQPALREIRRVLKPGGSAVIAISNGSSPLLRLDAVGLRVVAALQPVYRWVKGRRNGRSSPTPATSAGPVPSAPYRRFYRQTWLRLLRGASFEPEEWVCHGWGWLRSPLGLLARFLSTIQSVLGQGLERLLGRERVRRARHRLVRSRTFHWLGAEHVFRARVIK